MMIIDWLEESYTEFIHTWNPHFIGVNHFKFDEEELIKLRKLANFYENDSNRYESLYDVWVADLDELIKYIRDNSYYFYVIRKQRTNKNVPIFLIFYGRLG